MLLAPGCFSWQPYLPSCDCNYQLAAATSRERDVFGACSQHSLLSKVPFVTYLPVFTVTTGKVSVCNRLRGQEKAVF